MGNHFNGSEVAVIGMSCRMPGADNKDEFWHNIKNGIESISFFTREELREAGIREDILDNPNYVKANGALAGIDNFDAAFFGIGKREAEIMDPQHRIFLEEAYKALDDAGYSNAGHRTRIGVFAGCDMNTYLLTNLKHNEEQLRAAGDFMLMMSSDKDYLPTRTAYLLNLDGPAINVQTACSTSLVAIHLACQSLISPESDIMLAGGASIRPPMKQGYTYVKDMINSPDGHCRPFDAAAEGTVGGNGVGVVVLKLLTQAILDKDNIYAVIKGSAVNNDGGNKVGFTAPGIKGQSEVIREALAMAEVDVSSIGFLETHGTGTKMGDSIEMLALERAFRQFSKDPGFCALGAVKANIGHTSSAAGVAGFIKTVLAVQNGLIPPLINFTSINPKIPWKDSPFYIPEEAMPWPAPIRRAGISSFGIGGTNAHLVLENYHPPLREDLVSRSELISLSARTPEDLKQASSNLASLLAVASDVPLRDIALTCHLGREYHRHRLSVVCQSKEELYESLTSSSSRNVIKDYSRDSAPPVFFVFPGQGSHYAEMGAQLYNENSLFREFFDQCTHLLPEHLKTDIRLFRTERALGTEFAQPLIFCMEYALANVLIGYGIKPTAVIGHSLGDFAAAAIAGIISLADAVRLVSHRGRLMENCDPGSMTSVMRSAGDTQTRLNGIPALSIAAINATSNCSISGPVESITALEKQLQIEGIPYHRLATSRAFHNQMMEPCIGEFRKIVSGIQWSAPSIPMVSNVDGEIMSPSAGPLTGEYWITQMLHPVNFDKGVGQLLKYSSGIFIEVGPGKTLTNLIRQNKGKKNDHTLLVLLSQHPKKAESAQLLEAVGQLWSKGVPVNFEKMYAGSDARRCSLPPYPFAPQRHWITSQLHGIPAQPDGSPAGKEISFYYPLWKQSPFIPPTVISEPAKETLLVFLFGENILERLVNGLQPDHHELITIKKGFGFSKGRDGSYSLDPESPDDYALLFKSLSILPQTNINIWFDGYVSATQDCSAGIQKLVELSVLTRQIGNITGHHFTLHSITNSIHRITGEEMIVPSQALLQGFSKVIPLEYAHIKTRIIDISADPQTPARFTIEMMCKELDTDDGQPVVAIRGRQRFVMDWEESSNTPNSHYSLKTNGIYLITGGFKGVAVQIALAIASKKSNVRIALLGRSAATDSSHLDKLRSLVSGLKLIQCDVSDHDQVSSVIEALRLDWGEIDGVIHAAGLPDYHGIIHHRTRENIMDILRPKVQGTLVLDSCISYKQLDFFILLSSISTLFYKTKAGQAGYLAANEFIDAFAGYHRSIRKDKTMVINWNDWSEVGMSVKANSRLAAMLGIDTSHPIFADSVTTSEGQAAFLQLLELGHPRTIVSKKEVIDEFRKYDRFNLAEFVKSVRRRPLAPPLSSSPSPPLSATLSGLQQVIREIWMECLGVQTVDIHDNFFDFGGHSLLATQMIARMQEQFPATAIPSLDTVFRNPTIAGLAEYMENIAWLQQGPVHTMEREIGSI